MTFVKSTIMAAFAVFFMSASWAQEVPMPKPAEKAAPTCNTISKFFGDAEYITREHRNFIGIRFAYVAKDKNIVMFDMSGPCIKGKAMIIRRDHPYFNKIYELVFAGWDA